MIYSTRNDDHIQQGMSSRHDAELYYPIGFNDVYAIQNSTSLYILAVMYHYIHLLLTICRSSARL